MNIYQKLRFAWMYLGNPPWDTRVSPPELMHVIDTIQSGKALDIGCGTATNVITLAKHGWKVTGIDFIHRPIALGKKKARSEGVDVNLMVADVTTLKLDEKFDLILDMGCFHNLPVTGRERYTKSIRNWLDTSGLFLLYGFIKPEVNRSGRGINLSDIEKFEIFLNLINRLDGLDRQWSSGWFIFQKKITSINDMQT